MKKNGFGKGITQRLNGEGGEIDAPYGNVWSGSDKYDAERGNGGGGFDWGDGFGEIYNYGWGHGNGDGEGRLPDHGWGDKNSEMGKHEKI